MWFNKHAFLILYAVDTSVEMCFDFIDADENKQTNKQRAGVALLTAHSIYK